MKHKTAFISTNGLSWVAAVLISLGGGFCLVPSVVELGQLLLGVGVLFALAALAVAIQTWRAKVNKKDDDYPGVTTGIRATDSPGLKAPGAEITDYEVGVDLTRSPNADLSNAKIINDSKKKSD